MGRKLKDVLWFALVCAKNERLSFVDAYSGDKKEKSVRDALSDIKAFEVLQKKFFGTTKTKLDAKMEKMKEISIYDLRKLVDTNPELFDVHTEAENE